MIGMLGSLLGSQGGRMIGGMIGGRTGAMVGGLAGSLLGARQIGRLGGLVRGGRGDGDRAADTHSDGPPPMQEREAEILISAMCNAAKADGVMDETETEQIVGELGDITPQEQTFLRNEIASPARSAADMARAVPPELAAEAYAVSLIAINVDTSEEASYLRELASALGLSDNDRDNIHDDLGADLL